MVQLGDHDENAFLDCYLGPLLDEGVPYSGLGIAELHEIQKTGIPTWDGILYPFPDAVKDTPFLQHGSGEHASEPRSIIGPILCEHILMRERTWKFDT